MNSAEVIRYGTYVTIDCETGLMMSSGFLGEPLSVSSAFPLKSIFRILPQSVTTTQEALISSVNNENFKDRYLLYKGILVGEISSNISTTTSYFNSSVTFGSIVQLQHLFSKRFLSMSTQKHEEHRDKFKLTLSTFSNENSCFYIQSAFKYQEEGTAFIKSGSKVVICGLLKEIDRFINLDVIEDTNEIVGNIENKLAMTINLYSAEKTSDEFLMCGDYLQLIHSEENSCLIATNNSYDKSLIDAHFSHNHLNSNSIWVIENIENFKGGLIYSGLLYTIKHATSGLYLAIESYEGKHRLTFSSASNENYWRIEQNVQEKPLISEKFYRVVHDALGLTLGAEFVSELGISSSYVPSLTYDNANVSYFKLKKCSHYFADSALFLVTCQDLIKEFLIDIRRLFDKQNDDPLLILKKIKSIKECISDVELFCRNKLPKFISIDIPFGEIDSFKQNSLRDLNFISSLTEILQILSMHRFFAVKNMEIQQCLMKESQIIVNSIFKLFTVLCLDNAQNQEEAFRNILTYCKYIDKDPEANVFLVSLMKNNEALLFKMQKMSGNGTQDKNLKNRKSEMLEFLTVICTCENEAINANQEALQQYLFGNAENFAKVGIPVSSENGLNIDLILPHPSLEGEDIVRLDSCFENGQVSKFESEISYFTKLIYLFAAMCTGKNYLNAAFVSEWFTTRCLIYNLWNKQLISALRAGFGKLLSAVYIDCYSKIQSKRLEKVRIIELNYSKKNINKKIMRLESRFDVSDIYLKVISNNNEESLDEEDSEHTLHEIKEDVIQYFSEFNGDNFDELTLELLNITHKLLKFEIIGLGVYDLKTKVMIYDVNESEFSKEQTGVFRILDVADRILFSNIDEKRFRMATGKNVSHKALPEKANRQGSSRKTNLEKNENHENAMAIEGKHITDYLHAVLIDESESANYTDVEIECKIKLLEIMDFILEWRQDRLISNVLECFKDAVLNKKSISAEEFEHLLPDIIDVEHYEKKESNFKLFGNLEIPDLAWIGGDLLKKLLKLFMITKNYRMQSLILKIIMRCFSQRSRLLKNINKICLLTTKEDAELFNWLKIHMAIFSELGVQSEIWMKFFRTSNNSERNFKKYKKTVKILTNFEIFLNEDSWLGDGKIFMQGNVAKVSQSRQNLIVNLNIHHKIINLIKDAIHNLDDIYDDQDNDYTNYGREKLIELFKLAFAVLKKMVVSNKSNQKNFHKFLPVFLRNLRMSLGQIELICEVFRDNYELCSATNHHFLQKFVSLIENEGRQARFLEIFSVVMVVEGKPIHDVQRLVFKMLAESENYSFLFYLNENGTFSFQPTLNHVNPTYEDQPVLYHSKLIEVISKCAMGKTNIFLTEVKCQKFLPIPTIFQLLQESEMPSSKIAILRIPLLRYFYYSYIESEKYLEEIFRNVYLINLFSEKTKNFENSEDLIEIMVLIAADYTDRYIKEERFIYESFDDYDAISEYLSKLSSIRLPKSLFPAIEILKRLYNFSLVLQENDENALNDRFSKPIEPVLNEWNNLKTSVLSNKDISERLKSEKKALMNIIIKIEDYLLGINFQEFLIKIVAYIRQAYNKNPPIEILLNCIHFIISILSKLSINEAKVSEEHISKEFIQDKLCELGLVKIVLIIICEKNTHPKIYKKLINLSIELLDGGNLKVQSEFYEFFINSNKSQEFFHKIFNSLNSFKSNINSKSISFKDKKDSMLKLLRFLQLLCENHNSDLQNYLRSQKKSNSNYNIIEALVYLFQSLVSEKRYKSFFVLSQCIDTITEMIQGPCEKNQLALVDCKFLEHSAELLLIEENIIEDELKIGDEEESMKGWMIVHLKYKLSITLLSLLEINKDNTIISYMHRTFLDEIFKKNLHSVYKNYRSIYTNEEYVSDIFEHYNGNENYQFSSESNPQDLEKEKYLSVIELGFNLYHLKKLLKDHERKIKNIEPEDYKFHESLAPQFLSKGIVKDLFNLFKSAYKDLVAWANKIRRKKQFSSQEIEGMAEKFFEKHTGRIEIALENSRIIYVYFTLQPESLYLTQEIKDEFHEGVDRSSEKSKLQYLQLSNVDLMLEIQNEQRLDKLFRNYPFVSIITSNVRLYYSLGFLVTIWLNVMLISSYNSPYDNGNYTPVFCTESNSYGQCLQTTSSDRTASLFAAFGILHVLCGSLVLSFQLLKGGPKLYKQYKKEHYNKTSKRYVRFFQVTYCLVLVLFNLKILYYLVYTGLSFAAVIGKIYLLYSVHLFDVLYRFPSLQNVVKSIYFSRYVLAITYTFTIVLIYYMTLWRYTRLLEYDSMDCDSLYNCMIKTYDRSFKLGGMGWVLGDWTPGTFNLERLFFDNIYYIGISTLMMSMIKGIIYDAFFVLRNRTEADNLDREHVCYICGLEREDIEVRTNRSFKYHTEKEHNEWYYAFYVMYLLNKDKTELNSVETYVKNCLDKASILWYPQKTSFSLMVPQEDIDKKNEIEVESLQKDLQNLKQEILEVKDRHRSKSNLF